MQNYYEITIGVSSVTKKIKIVTNEMDCNNFELFDSFFPYFVFVFHNL